MGKLYYNQDTGVSVVSGRISSIAVDKMSCTVTVDKYDVNTKQSVKQEVNIKTNAPIDCEINTIVTATGFKRGHDITAETFSDENNYVSLEGLNILSGTVLFANTNKEVDAEGNPRLNKAGQPKKPHFDITIAAGEGAGRVTHTVKIYNFTKKDSGVVQDNIGRYEKLFAKHDRKENPIYCTIVTRDEGNEWIKTTTGADGKEWKNTMCSHMGMSSLDAIFVNEKVKEQVKTASAEATAPEASAPSVEPVAQAPAEPVQQAAPATSAPTPTAQVVAQAQTVENDGFELGAIDLSSLDDFSIEDL